MRAAEELRFLILAIQREGNRLLAAQLRPLGLTPSQAEVIRILADRGPLTLTALGELLVCETGTSPSRLIDRLVSQDLVQRDVDPADRRRVVLDVTGEGRQLDRRIVAVEEQLYATIDEHTTGQPVDAALRTLRTLAAAFPAGQAVDRRRHLNLETDTRQAEAR